MSKTKIALITIIAFLAGNLAGLAILQLVFSPPEPVSVTHVAGPALNNHHHPSEADASILSASAFTFDECLDSIEQEESGGDANAKGDLIDGVYRAIGSFQIWPIYVDEVNRICGLQQLTESFIYEDRLDRVRSRRMSLIHNQYWADFAMIATDMDYDEAFVRSHQGALGWKSESTKAYWAKVKARMEAK